MKNRFFYFIFILPFLVFSQKQTQEGNPVYPELIPVSKTSLLKDVDVIFNTRLAFENYFLDGNHTNSLFSVNQLRFEIKGKIHEKVFFRFRNRYTKISDPNTIDNISRTVDLAHVIVDASPDTKITFGKMIGDWGGYELLLNPIEVLSFNSIIDKSDIFLVGAAVTHTLPDSKSKFNVQILNSKTKTFEEQYGAFAPPGVEEAKVPLIAVGNWKGALFDGKLETSYSYCYGIDADNMYRNYFTLGNKYKNDKLVLYYDFHYSNEDLDQKGIVSSIVKSQNTYTALDVAYLENWIRAEYKITPKFNLLLSVMNHKSYWYGNPDVNNNSNLLNSYGVIPTVEYAPFKDFNMKFYMAYIGRKYNYTSYAENNYNVNDYTTGQISFGIIAPLLVL